MSDIEGKAAMGSGERRGTGVSFNADNHRLKILLMLLLLLVIASPAFGRIGAETSGQGPRSPDNPFA